MKYKKLSSTIACLFSLFCSAIHGQSVNDTPKENRDQGTVVVMDSASELVQSLLDNLQKNDHAGARSLFFPEDAFLKLKAVKNPKEYYDSLMKEYDSQLNKMRTLVQGKNAKFLGFRKGFCKWKQVGTEYNNIPYWSCYKNQWDIDVDGKKISLPLRTMINWGPKWYITHLGKA